METTITQYGLYHIPTKKYVCYSDEGGNGLGDSVPDLTDKISHLLDIEDVVIELENVEENEDNVNGLPIDEFEVHEFQCTLTKKLNIDDLKERRQKETQEKYIEYFKTSRIDMGLKPLIVMNESELQERDQFIDDTLSDIIKEI